MLIRRMNKNPFFKNFMGEYHRKLARTFEGAAKTSKAGGSKSVPPTAKKGKKVNYGKQITEHINNANFFRKYLPDMFSGDSKPNWDQMAVIRDKMKSISPVPVPLEIKNAKEHQQVLKLNRSPAGSKRSLDLETINGRAAEKNLASTNLTFLIHHILVGLSNVQFHFLE